MNRYRNAPGLRGPTKASANTLCQKCLKRDNYECKATAQDRPYTSRPSRTQQLQNPRLMPKLSTEVPNDLIRTKGVADEILAKRDEERGRKRDLEEDMPDHRDYFPKRARSVSSHSISSISTISTNRSVSASSGRDQRRAEDVGHRPTSRSPSPAKSRKRRYSDSAESYSGSSYSSGGRHQSRSRDWGDERNTRRRRRESSPDERGRHRESRRDTRRDQRSTSADKSQVAKERRSMTPNVNHDRPGRRSYRDRKTPPAQTYASQPKRSNPDPRMRPDPPRERSLSPYSKRLALTQAMNMDR